MSRLRPLCLAVLLLTHAGAVIADDDRDRRAELRVPVDPNVRVDIEIISGDIEIEAWDKPELRIRSSGVPVTALDIESDSDWVSVRGSRGGGWLPFSISGAEIDLRIDVPKKSYVRAKTINGSIEAKGVEGRISFHAANGEIDVEGAPTEAYLETVTGDIELEGRGSQVDTRTVNGEIELSGVRGEVVASAMNGSIEVRGDVIERADLRTLSGSIDLEAELAPGARVNCKTISGRITLELPTDTSAVFDVQSFSGRIRNEFGALNISGSRGGPGQRLELEAGDGDGRVTLDTFSGRVEIRTRD